MIESMIWNRDRKNFTLELFKLKRVCMSKNVKGGYPQNLINTAEAAKLLGISAIGLFRRRKDKVGPPYYRVGNKVLYSKEEILKFLEKTKVEK